ncbi:uncharacterized protein LOC125554410 [Triticum urartu]|uniref:uncharacterized protein LOC125554410 n=1 Tax=Triticum urartu TaxID=4572 RepID=UPI0020439505|nr:uncharacterized protein LOC125554410 [Triticum urartu]
MNPSNGCNSLPSLLLQKTWIPPQGFVKLNVDGALSRDNQSGSVCAICRDDSVVSDINGGTLGVISMVVAFQKTQVNKCWKTSHQSTSAFSDTAWSTGWCDYRKIHHQDGDGSTVSCPGENSCPSIY